jgi:serine/threonine-protein kinase RsbW
VSILFSKSITGCESNCIRAMIQDMMECIKAWKRLSDDEEYEFRLILNELIANGTVHGNKRLCDKSIKAKIIAIDHETIGITIQDEGSGFDYRNFFNNIYPCDANPYSERGRGLKLIRAVCDDIVFNQNGNEVSICKTIKKSN